MSRRSIFGLKIGKQGSTEAESVRTSPMMKGSSSPDLTTMHASGSNSQPASAHKISVNRSAASLSTSSSTSSSPLSNRVSQEYVDIQVDDVRMSVFPSKPSEVNSGELHDRLASLRSRVMNRASTEERLPHRSSLDDRMRPSEGDERLRSQSAAELLKRRVSISGESVSSASSPLVELPEDCFEIVWQTGPLGVVFSLDDTTRMPIVQKVLKNSQGDFLAISVGDILTAINGRSTAVMDFDSLQKSLAQGISATTLQFRRRDEQATGEPMAEEDIERVPVYSVVWADKNENLGIVISPGKYGYPVVKRIKPTENHFGKEMVRAGDLLISINNQSTFGLETEYCYGMLKSDQQAYANITVLNFRANVFKC